MSPSRGSRAWGTSRSLHAGEWIDRVGATTSASDEYTESAIRKQQAQILTLAQQALDEIPLERRHQSAMLMAIDTRKIAEAKKKIKRFRRGLSEFLEKSPSRDEVYYLSVSLFPVTRSTAERNPR